MRIDVTQEDIDHGLAMDCRLCPVARAIERATALRAEAGVYSFMLYDKAVIVGSWDLPTVATDFIKAFDFDEPVAPFSFDIDYEPPA